MIMKKINERKICVDIYADIKKGAPSQTALQNMESYTGIDSRQGKKGNADDLNNGIPKHSRSFITRVVYGTLENYIYIDYIISEFTGKTVSKLKPFIRNVLEISVYQLIFMDSVPAHAAINEAVRMVASSPQRGLKGFVNAVLRNIERHKNSLPEVRGDEIKRLSVRYSVPEFIIRVISDTLEKLDFMNFAGDDRKKESAPVSPVSDLAQDAFAQASTVCNIGKSASFRASEKINIGESVPSSSIPVNDNCENKSGLTGASGSPISLTEHVESHCTPEKAQNSPLHQATEGVLKGLRAHRPVTIRCNTSLTSPDRLKKLLSQEGVSVGEIDTLPDYVMTISGYDSISGLKTFKDGLFYVQDSGSILSGAVSDFKPGEKVLDLCGAPGGKAIGAALAGALVQTGDVSEAKVSMIQENIARLKLQNINAHIRDACVYDPSLEGAFDAVICDVPCSGIGIIGRKPDICMNLTPEGIRSLTELQKSILKNAVKYVKPGGRLIYSTCTINVRENHENGRFPEAYGFEPVFEKQWLPGVTGTTDGFYTKILKKT